MAQVFRRMTDGDLDTKPGQTLGDVVRRQVGTGHDIPQIMQYFGNPAHSGTADADEMHVPYTCHRMRRHDEVVLVC